MAFPFKMRVQLAAGFEFDCECVSELVFGDSELNIAAAIVSEFVDAGMCVLSASIRGVAVSDEWLDKQHEDA